jgi:queuosine biosynthesis protein QueD
MRLTLYTEDFFKSAHKLPGYNGKCERLHGHTWKVCVWVNGDESQRDDLGIMWDFNSLKQVIEVLDHRYLNEIVDFIPTCENLTLHVYQELKAKRDDLDFKIRVYENITGTRSYCELGDF